MAEVVLNNVRKNYDPSNLKDTLRSVNLNIKEGEFVVFVGPSGCGKSTLLRMIAGLEDITSGELTIGGKYMNDVPPDERNVGMVFQSYALYPHMNVYENMAFGLKLKKMDKDTIHKRVSRAADILGLVPLLERKPKALSGGQRQRVAIGRSIVQQPSVFLFDEPLSNLDAALRVKMRIEIAKLHKELNSTIIYVTHDQVEAMTLADKIVVLSPLKETAETNLEQFGSPLDLYHNPANKFVAGFIGSPAMNFLPARVCATDQGLALDLGLNQPVRLPPAKTERLRGYLNQQVWFGIRPEHIRYRSAPPCDKPTLRADIQLIEAMGNEMYLHFLSGEWPLLSRTAYEDCAALQAGDSVHFELDVAQAHLFDVHTEVAI